MSRPKKNPYKGWSITPKKVVEPKTREELKADVEAWLAKGNKIEKVPSTQEWGKRADLGDW